MNVDTGEYENRKRVIVNPDRRRSKSIQEWATIIAIIFQFGYVIYSVGRQNESIANMLATQSRQNIFLDKVADKLAGHDVDIAVLKAKDVRIEDAKIR